MGLPANITNRSKVAGMGEQPSIINRDPGDESGRKRPDWEGICNQQSQSLDAAIARINELKAENARHYQAHEQYVDAQRVLMKNACDWRDAEIAKLRADLAKLMAATPSTAPTPPPHDPMANALAHSEPRPAWQR